jgi:hypothetical protein
VVRVRLTGTGEEILNPELLRAVRGADPRSFAMVMATGIVSVALRQVGAQGLSAALLWVAVVAFAVLVVASAWRVVAFGQDVRDELRRPDRVFSYFAFPAAASVVAARLAGSGSPVVVAVLAVVTVLAWIAVTCVVPAFVARARRAIADVNGTCGWWELSRRPSRRRRRMQRAWCPSGWPPGRPSWPGRPGPRSIQLSPGW